MKIPDHLVGASLELNEHENGYVLTYECEAKDEYEVWWFPTLADAEKGFQVAYNVLASVGVVIDTSEVQQRR